MRLFLDASLSPALAEALAARGYDVIAQRQVLATNAPDTKVLGAAFDDRRIIVARDYDMAELVLRGFANAVGVVIVAFDLENVHAEAERIDAELRRLGDQSINAVIVLERSRVRRRPYNLST
jgi:predicted nuclease of predicted toxin-antitoxin system